MSDEKIVNFTDVKVTRDATASMAELMRDSLHGAVEQIAIMRGGESDEWIDRRTSACVDTLQAMIDATVAPVELPLPPSLSIEDAEAVRAAVLAWGRNQNDLCRLAFVSHLIALLGP